MYEPPTEIMAKVGYLLREPLEDETLRKQLTKIEVLRCDLAEKRCEWYKLLAEKKNQMLYPKDKDKTELDRRVMLNASVANIEKDYLFLETLEHLVEERIKLGSLFLGL